MLQIKTWLAVVKSFVAFPIPYSFWFLALAGCFANSIGVNFFLDFKFHLGSVATLLALRLLGDKRAFLLHLIITIPLILTSASGSYLFLVSGELAFLLSTTRVRRFDILFYSFIYWMLVTPIVVGFDQWTGGSLVSFPDWRVEMVGYVLNGMLNALFAHIIYVSVSVSLRSVLGSSFRMSLREVFVYAFFSIVFVPSSIFIMYTIHLIEKDTQAKIEHDVDYASQIIDQFFNRLIQTKLNAIDRLKRRLAKVELSDEKLVRQILSDFHLAAADFANIYVADGDANTLFWQPPVDPEGNLLATFNFADRDYYKKILNTRQAVVSDVFLGRGGLKVPITTIVSPHFVDNRLAFYVLGALDVSAISEMLRVSVDSDVRVYLLDSRERLIASTHGDFRVLSKYIYSDKDLPNEHWLGVNRFGWKAHIVIVTERYKKEKLSATVDVIILLLVISSLSLVISFLVSSSLEKYFSKLSHATTVLRDNKTQPEWPYSSFSELNTLVENFRLMKSELDSKFRELDQANLSLNSLSASLKDRNESLTIEIKHRAKIEEKLNEALKELESANQAKSDFLANISHEIRSPLTAIIGFAELLKKKQEMSSRERELFIETIHRNGRHLLELLGNVLDIAKIEAGHLNVSISKVLIRDELEPTFSALRMLAKRSGVELKVEFADDFPFEIMSDPIFLRQIVWNLVGNAIKFTRKGGVSTNFFCKHKDSRFMHLVISVVDTGIGIDSQLIEKLFEPFSRQLNTIDLEVDSTGLGLALSRKLARLLSGDIVLVDTKVGEGSRFDFEFCVPNGSNLQEFESTNSSSSNRYLENLKIAVVDDAPDSRLLLEVLLSSQGAEVCLFSTGAQAYEELKKSSFDLMITDLEMPEMNGIELAQKLSSNGLSIPTIAFSAHATEEKKQSALASGIDAFLSKPVSLEGLLAEIEYLIKSKLTPP